MIRNAPINGTHETANEETVLILAPFGRDASLIAQALSSAGISSRIEKDDVSLARSLAESGCAIIAAEALVGETTNRIKQAIDTQLAWSDLPLVVLCGRSIPAEFDISVRSLGNVTVVQRPITPASLLSVVRSAIRARRRQYQVRRLLEESIKHQGHIEALNERLKRAMTETHHRVKNNLQIITALVDMRVLEANSSVPIDEVKRIGRLTHSLAVVHDVLTHQAKDDGEARFVSARAIVEKLVAMLREPIPDRQLTFSADDTQLSSRQGTSLALVLSELVGNAIKHGKGNVDVVFTVGRDSAALSVSDQGPGFPTDFDAQRSVNTGLELVDSLARWDLAGQIDFENSREGGACVRVTIPLQTVPDSHAVEGKTASII